MSNKSIVETSGSKPATRSASVLQYSLPAADLHHSAGTYLLEVELPGVAKSGIELSVEDGQLHITGRRANPAPEGKTLHREIAHADFRRVFDLDPTLDTSSIQADLDQGLLKIRLKKAEAHKPRKISVN